MTTSPTHASPDARADELRAFVAVARSGSTIRAAAQLGRTQPAISARLAALERAWGTRLFSRQSRGMRLTPEGARLLPSAEQVLRGLDELDRLAGLPVARPTELRLGAGDALGRELLPKALARLLRREREMEVHLREAPTPLLLDALTRGEIDLALVVMAAGEAPPSGIELEPLIESPVVLLAPAGKKGKIGREPVPLSALAERRLVTLQPDSSFRRHLERAFEAAGVPFKPAVELGNLSLVQRFVAAGLGFAPVPRVAFTERSSLRGVRSLDLAGVGPSSYQRAIRAGVPLPVAAEKLMAALRERAERMEA
jgi:DNA-binding transcriptional LysR family regulator